MCGRAPGQQRDQGLQLGSSSWGGAPVEARHPSMITVYRKRDPPPQGACLPGAARQDKLPPIGELISTNCCPP